MMVALCLGEGGGGVFILHCAVMRGGRCPVFQRTPPIPCRKTLSWSFPGVSFPAVTACPQPSSCFLVGIQPCWDRWS